MEGMTELGDIPAQSGLQSLVHAFNQKLSDICKLANDRLGNDKSQTRSGLGFPDEPTLGDVLTDEILRSQADSSSRELDEP